MIIFGNSCAQHLLHNESILTGMGGLMFVMPITSKIN